MAEIVVENRLCPRCKTLKQLAEYHRNKARKSGFSCYCKRCSNEIVAANHRTPQGRMKLKARQQRYNKTEKAKAKRQRERQRDELLGVIPARQAVWREIAAGRLTPAKTKRCAHCSNRAYDYHHHKGYNAEHHLSVIPLCRSCHSRAHEKDSFAAIPPSPGS